MNYMQSQTKKVKSAIVTMQSQSLCSNYPCVLVCEWYEVLTKIQLTGFIVMVVILNNQCLLHTNVTIKAIEPVAEAHSKG